MSVSEIDALLYLPGHPRDRLEHALHIPALSKGWRSSFENLLMQGREDALITGNAGLTVVSSAAPAWQGFRFFRVARKMRENETVTSLVLEPADGQPLADALPGQFIVLRLEGRSGPTLMRSYSLSGGSRGTSYRISVKREGAASTYISKELRVDDVVEASAARGSFTLKPGYTPVVLLSAGIGVTPVLAMLHAMAAEHLHDKSGGYMALETARSIHLLRRRASYLASLSILTVTFATARQIPRIGSR